MRSPLNTVYQWLDVAGRIPAIRAIARSGRAARTTRLDFMALREGLVRILRMPRELRAARSLGVRNGAALGAMCYTATFKMAACERTTIANAQSRQITVACSASRPPRGLTGSTSTMTIREWARVTRPQSGQGSWIFWP
ncbi:MAG TPA: hypothetical protein VN697_12345 [Tepidiformaceae bacterium]|nr:hypothetical protein [Tepidiformaceae bacterium]